jgi:lysophospholipase L1-like esterase
MAAQGAVIQRLEQGDHLNIAAIGTSLTDANFNAQNWFAQTGAWLQAKYPGQVALSNRAVSGTASLNLPQFDRAHGGTWQLEQVLANDNPDAIFIEFAINDAYKAFNISPTASANSLKTLIDRIKNWSTNRGKTVDIIVQTMNNTGPSYAASENDTAPYYQAWREQAVASKVLLIDHEPNWLRLYNSQADHAAWKGYVTDDIHPNTLGATNVIVPEVQRVLMGQVPEPSCFVLLGPSMLGLLCYAWRNRNHAKTFD